MRPRNLEYAHFRVHFLLGRRSGGAIFIDGRAGYVGLDPAVPNWESGIDLTVLRSTFFRNFATFTSGGLTLFDAWPFVGKVDETDFVRW